MGELKSECLKPLWESRAIQTLAAGPVIRPRIVLIGPKGLSQSIFLSLDHHRHHTTIPHVALPPWRNSQSHQVVSYSECVALSLRFLPFAHPHASAFSGAAV